MYLTSLEDSVIINVLHPPVSITELPVLRLLAPNVIFFAKKKSP